MKKQNQILFNQKIYLYLIFFFILLPINNIIKAQNITNIIKISDKDFRYINFANYSNNDLIVETTSPESSKRMFYGLKENGEYFFEKNSKQAPFYSIISENSSDIKTESEFFIIKTEDEGKIKEYPISISMNEQYCELYDFENNDIIKIKSSDFLEKKMTSVRETALTFISEGKKG